MQAQYEPSVLARVRHAIAATAPAVRDLEERGVRSAACFFGVSTRSSRIDPSMARKSRTPDFAQILDTLRAHGFSVTPFTGVQAESLSQAWRRCCARAGKDAAVAFWERPRHRRRQIARLLDRGYQKFLKTPNTSFRQQPLSCSNSRIRRRADPVDAASVSTTSRWARRATSTNTTAQRPRTAEPSPHGMGTRRRH